MILLLLSNPISASHHPGYISTSPGKEHFTLAESGKTTTLIIDPEDYPGVIIALGDLITDIGRVTQYEPAMIFDALPGEEELVIVGMLGESRLVQQLVDKGKLDATALEGKWETFIIQTFDDPFPEVERALVIAGSDKRGTLYGIYDVSEQIGVSPWYWWADVPV